MATLTGAQGVATGKYHASLLTNEEAWEPACAAAGKASGDLVVSTVKMYKCLERSRGVRKQSRNQLGQEWHSWVVHVLRCARSRVRFPVTSHPCFNFSPFCVACSFDYNALNTLKTEHWWREGGKMSAPSNASLSVIHFTSYPRKIWLLCLNLYLKAACKRTQHCWPTAPNIVGCYMLRLFAHPVASCCAKFETVKTDATLLGVVAPFARSLS